MLANLKIADTPEFLITRVFDAPRDMVWDAWTVPEKMGKWWGPKGFTSRVIEMDLKPGGVFRSWLKSPDGMEVWGKFVYQEITPPARLVWLHSFSDKDGGITRHPFSMTWPLVLLTTVTLEEEGAGNTKLTLRWVPVDAKPVEVETFAQAVAGMGEGWGGTLELLGNYLKTLKV